MIDINAILNAAVKAAVDEQLTALQQHYANAMGDLANRLVRVEALIDRLPQTTVTLEADAAKQLSNNREFRERLMEIMGEQEWLWNGINNYVNEKISGYKGSGVATELSEALEDRIRDKIEAMVVNFLTEHCNEFDHEPLKDIDDALEEKIKAIYEDNDFKIRIR